MISCEECETNFRRPRWYHDDLAIVAPVHFDEICPWCNRIMLPKCEPAAAANEGIEAGTPANRGIQAVRGNQPSKEKPPPIHIGGNGIFRFDVEIGRASCRERV